jgi:hypothetical protein
MEQKSDRATDEVALWPRVSDEMLLWIAALHGDDLKTSHINIILPPSAGPASLTCQASG